MKTAWNNIIGSDVTLTAKQFADPISCVLMKALVKFDKKNSDEIDKLMPVLSTLFGDTTMGRVVRYTVDLMSDENWPQLLMRDFYQWGIYNRSFIGLRKLVRFSMHYCQGVKGEL